VINSKSKKKQATKTEPP